MLLRSGSRTMCRAAKEGQEAQGGSEPQPAGPGGEEQEAEQEEDAVPRLPEPEVGEGAQLSVLFLLLGKAACLASPNRPTCQLSCQTRACSWPALCLTLQRLACACMVLQYIDFDDLVVDDKLLYEELGLTREEVGGAWVHASRGARV